MMLGSVAVAMVIAYGLGWRRGVLAQSAAVQRLRVQFAKQAARIRSLHERDGETRARGEALEARVRELEDQRDAAYEVIRAHTGIAGMEYDLDTLNAMVRSTPGEHR
jgi:hypothetical protein